MFIVLTSVFVVFRVGFLKIYFQTLRKETMPSNAKRNANLNSVKPYTVVVWKSPSSAAEITHCMKYDLRFLVNFSNAIFSQSL